MRHRFKGRKLGRNGSHRSALFMNLARGLILTLDQGSGAKVEGRIRTTLAKAKEIQPFVERLVAIAVRARVSAVTADGLKSGLDRCSEEWKGWRKSESGQNWLAAQAKYIHLHRSLFSVLKSNQIVDLLIRGVGDRFANRPGGYTRVVKVAKRRLADGAFMALLEFVGEPNVLVLE